MDADRHSPSQNLLPCFILLYLCLHCRNKSNLTMKGVVESASDEEDATEGSSSESSESESDSDVPIESVESQASLVCFALSAG